MVAEAGIDPDRVLVVGALCRDVLHAACGHEFGLRGTTDADVGVALEDWGAAERIERAFPRIGSNGIRYLIAGIPVDVMPFGEVEDPAGVTEPAGRGEELVVFGFRDVYERALSLPLPTGVSVRLHEPAGYAALKIRAWLDRGDDRDARDLAVATYWYRESADVESWLFDSDEGMELLLRLDMDTDLVAARLLGRDLLSSLSWENGMDLLERWKGGDQGLLSRYFVAPPAARWPMTASRRREVVGQLLVAE
ncbi:MAG: hypothetical protein QM621_08900 [Aeromicrobium sp.]|uniref:hypothetical protein n=1 Tax=Aeromicrobium sp. TaxID=1871063 RepID=UPI0039E71402